MPPLSIENNLENKITHIHTQKHTCTHWLTYTHMPSPNTHQLLGQRKIYISSQELRCLCTRWVCLSLGLTPVAHLIRLLCMCECLILSVRVWEKGEYDSVRVCLCTRTCMVEKCHGVRDVADRIVQTHTWDRIKVIDQLWHALTQRSKLNPDQWHLFVCVCVCFYASSQFSLFLHSTLIFLLIMTSYVL